MCRKMVQMVIIGDGSGTGAVGTHVGTGVAADAGTVYMHSPYKKLRLKLLPPYIVAPFLHCTCALLTLHPRPPYKFALFLHWSLLTIALSLLHFSYIAPSVLASRD